MNYLAHLYLADGTPHSLLGNLLGDFVKGNDLLAFPEGVRCGIRMHRQVDSFTDRHMAFHRSVSRISPRWGWFAGIIIDVYYDHLLASRWERYSPTSLRTFADGVYRVLEEHRALLPPHAKKPVARIIANDRLFSYARLEGITAALVSISQRIRERIPRRPVHLEDAVLDLQACHAELSADFDIFFPELVAFTAEWKRTAPVSIDLNPPLPEPVVPIG